MQEFMSLVRGLQLAVHHCFHNLHIVLDAESLIYILQELSLIHLHTIDNCRSLLRQLHDPLIRHSYREFNMVADRLAHFGTEISGSNITFLAEPLPFVLELLQKDRDGLDNDHLVTRTSRIGSHRLNILVVIRGGSRVNGGVHMHS
ncbi:hypothetical protein RND71_019279 [Anisodus tanguticus]|uniref:RNase H type-1 domain-containing protein n=1 Tax=Anisodus tanguticus TaxID=243964 RepID=A0AAE1RZ57_9SOLA|nr:hypothetical protein RND71_019279 [Anisodus tanguticus]